MNRLFSKVALICSLVVFLFSYSIFLTMFSYPIFLLLRQPETWKLVGNLVGEFFD